MWNGGFKGNTQQDELNGFPGNEQPQENPRMNKKDGNLDLDSCSMDFADSNWNFSFFIIKGNM